MYTPTTPEICELVNELLEDEREASERAYDKLTAQVVIKYRTNPLFRMWYFGHVYQQKPSREEYDRVAEQIHGKREDFWVNPERGALLLEVNEKAAIALQVETDCDIVFDSSICVTMEELNRLGVYYD